VFQSESLRSRFDYKGQVAKCDESNEREKQGGGQQGGSNRVAAKRARSQGGGRKAAVNRAAVGKRTIRLVLLDQQAVGVTPALFCSDTFRLIARTKKFSV